MTAAASGSSSAARPFQWHSLVGQAEIRVATGLGLAERAISNRPPFRGAWRPIDAVVQHIFDRYVHANPTQKKAWLPLVGALFCELPTLARLSVWDYPILITDEVNRRRFEAITNRYGERMSGRRGPPDKMLETTLFTAMSDPARFGSPPWGGQYDLDAGRRRLAGCLEILDQHVRLARAASPDIAARVASELTAFERTSAEQMREVRPLLEHLKTGPLRRPLLFLMVESAMRRPVEIWVHGGPVLGGMTGALRLAVDREIARVSREIRGTVVNRARLAQILHSQQGASGLLTLGEHAWDLIRTEGSLFAIVAMIERAQPTTAELEEVVCDCRDRLAQIDLGPLRDMAEKLQERHANSNVRVLTFAEMLSRLQGRLRLSDLLAVRFEAVRRGAVRGAVGWAVLLRDILLETAETLRLARSTVAVYDEILATRPHRAQLCLLDAVQVRLLATRLVEVQQRALDYLRQLPLDEEWRPDDVAAAAVSAAPEDAAMVQPDNEEATDPWVAAEAQLDPTEQLEPRSVTDLDSARDVLRLIAGWGRVLAGQGSSQPARDRAMAEVSRIARQLTDRIHSMEREAPTGSLELVKRLVRELVRAASTQDGTDRETVQIPNWMMEDAPTEGNSHSALFAGIEAAGNILVHWLPVGSVAPAA